MIEEELRSPKFRHAITVTSTASPSYSSSLPLFSFPFFTFSSFSSSSSSSSASFISHHSPVLSPLRQSFKSDIYEKSIS
ncbi:hypothetical protein E2C01_054081 [Portunus trituberculatus]|uniref:Uncharacterized protein n=1 Tax=Portunus trituberculatus TaxID=210409 RepID=A0A5B7GQZ7_PORTR|nr:hypothetical protein [Portunus trituberculatus]